MTAAGGGKRGGEHNNNPNEGHAGHRALKLKDGNSSEGGGGGDCGGKGYGSGVCCLTSMWEGKIFLNCYILRVVSIGH